MFSLVAIVEIVVTVVAIVSFRQDLAFGLCAMQMLIRTATGGRFLGAATHHVLCHLKVCTHDRKPVSKR